MPSIPDTLRYTAARCPDREALVFGDHRRTYSELYEEVERTAAALVALGTNPGDRVLLFSPNSDAFVVAAQPPQRTTRGRAPHHRLRRKHRAVRPPAG